MNLALTNEHLLGQFEDLIRNQPPYATISCLMLGPERPKRMIRVVLFALNQIQNTAAKAAISEQKSLFLSVP
jgi:hypothetical protein